MTDTGPPSPRDPVPSAVGPRPGVGAGTPATPVADAATTDDGFWGDRPPSTGSAGTQPGIHGPLRTILEWVAVAVGALAVALLIKAFLLQAFYIPSASMEPTLHENDRVLVNKLSYRFGDVQRGDIVVFSKPPGAGGSIDDFIKRVIALPGETISFSGGTVFVDGRAIVEDYVHGVRTTNGNPIPGCANEPAAADTCKVPDGMVFVMGDNRDDSADSRSFGPIDEESIVGRAFLKVWPLGDLGFL